MKKYLALFQTQTAIYFTYRLSFLLWRVRNVLNFIIIYFLWTSVYQYKNIIFSYTQEKMITYVLLVGIVNALVLSTRATDVAELIVSGDIMHYLLKPISFFSVVTAKELVDKMMNGVLSVVELIIFVLLIKPTIFMQTDAVAYIMFFIALLIAGAISYFISFGLSLIAFWTSETWAPRFIYFILISVLAGTAFPLDILPKNVYSALLLTPFPYLVYLPIKIYIDGFNNSLILPLILGFIWSVVLFFLAKFLWQKGMREFSFFGK